MLKAIPTHLYSRSDLVDRFPTTNVHLDVISVSSLKGHGHKA